MKSLGAIAPYSSPGYELNAADPPLPEQQAIVLRSLMTTTLKMAMTLKILMGLRQASGFSPLPSYYEDGVEKIRPNCSRAL
jgi:hypothetical protein